MERIKLIIADNDAEYANNLSSFFDKQDNIDVLAVAKDGNEALSFIESKNPDVVISEMMMPYLDGLGIVEKINEMNIKKVPLFMILSSIHQDKIVKRAYDMGVEYYMVKPFDLGVLVSRIKRCGSQKNLPENSPIFIRESTPAYPATNGALERDVTDAIREAGIPAHLKGYQYLRSAIMIAVVNMDILNSITKELYPTISDEYNSTPGKVERAIRHAINIAWSRNRINAKASIFDYTVNNEKGKPTNSEFIATAADKLRLIYK